MGRCSVCPNWIFSSEAERERHRRLLHPETKTSLLVALNNRSFEKQHICRFKVRENVECGKNFKSYHLLYKHKKKEKHVRNRGLIADENNRDTNKAKEKFQTQKRSIKTFFDVTADRCTGDAEEENDVSTDESESESDDEACAAEPCLIGKCDQLNIDWIDCDNCAVVSQFLCWR